MIDIFISYSRKDQEFIECVKPALKRLKIEENVKYFQDIDNIQAGEDFKCNIESAISDSTVILCFLSNNYFSSTFIQENELPKIEARFHRGVTLIPILIEEVFIHPGSIFARVQRMYFPEQTLSVVKEKNAWPGFLTHFEKVLRQEFSRFPRNEANPIKIRYNLVVVGKAGVGKSELINYLFGDKIRNTGIGAPVTSLGFHRTDFDILDIPASIFDSAGLEVGNFMQWKAVLDVELERRGPTGPVQNWFHTVLYCIQGVGSRIDPFEWEVINRFIEERYKVIVVITKSYIKRPKLEELAKSIQDKVPTLLRFVYVNSLDEEMGDTVVKQTGKNELIHEIQMSLVESLTERIPARCIGFMNEYIDKKCQEQIDYTREHASTQRHNVLADKVRNALKQITVDIRSPKGHFHQIITRETRHTLGVYSQIAKIIDGPIFFDDQGLISIDFKEADVPRFKSWSQILGEMYEDSMDLDLDDENGAFINGVITAVITPLMMAFGTVASFFVYLSDLTTWENDVIREIEKFKDGVKKGLWNNEAEIKKLYAERLRNVRSF